MSTGTNCWQFVFGRRSSLQLKGETKPKQITVCTQNPSPSEKIATNISAKNKNKFCPQFEFKCNSTRVLLPKHNTRSPEVIYI